MTTETCELEAIMNALQSEKTQLEEKLNSVYLDESEKEQIEVRIGEICADLEIHKIEIQPGSHADPQVRRSEREKRLTERMFELKKDELIKREKSFLSTYMQFKAEVQLTRSKLKVQCSKSELVERIRSIEQSECDVKHHYESIRVITAPPQDVRRKMDSCTSVSAELILLLKRRYADVDKEFDAEAVKESLQKLLQRQDAKSIYGSTVSRAEKSQHDLSSQSSHVTAKRAEAAARLAAKRAEVNREIEISAQRREIVVQQERLKMLEIHRDLDAIEAEYNVYVEEETKANAEIRDIEVKATSLSQPLEQWHSSLQPQVHLSAAPLSFPATRNVQDSEKVAVPQTSDIQIPGKDSEVSLVEALKESLTMTRLPAPEPFVFSGDPLKFVEWRTCFKALIESGCVSSAHRLFYLKKYISGEALSVLEGTFYRSDEEAYVQAWGALNKRYGHPFVIQRAFRGKLSSWPKIGSKESLRLREFSDFLISCKNAMPYVQGLKILDDCEENQKILLKLPDWVTARWNRHVTKTLDEEKEYPGFVEFAEFVAKEAQIACNPVSSLLALKGLENPIKEQKRIKASALNTTKTIKNSRTCGAVQSNKSYPDTFPARNKSRIECICCKESHFIYKCEKFAAMSLQEKRKFVIENNMCFGCLRVGHISRNCRQKANCNICRKNHPTPLHEDHPKVDKCETQLAEENASAVSNNVKVDHSDHTSMIVPVWLSCTKGNEQETLVYALLDTQSSNTFIDKEISDKLKADSEPVKLKLTTMTDKGSIMPSFRVSGLKVRGYYSQEYIELPPAYTREYIPLEQNSVPTCKTAEAWPHLHSIAKEIPNLLDCPAALLIGYDCARALKPRKVIPGNDHDPYAVKTDLGWSIVGSMKPWTSAMDVTGTCHRNNVKELPSITPSSVIKVLETDFMDTNPSEENISQEDFQFLQFLNENIHYNSEDHLEMPLPFKERPQLPNNKQLAKLRLKQLKGKMQRNPKYKEDYVRFMASVFEDGDAEEADSTSQDGCVNYGLKFLAQEHEKEYPEAASFIHKNFYVDDGLISLDSIQRAKQLVSEAQEICEKGKLRLHKFICNKKEVLDAIPVSERACNDKDTRKKGK
ncbi:uncharacterized protein LOC105356638 [Oryzias latipes]|uniref:uncharacterized protein LOC105356638 n=1 Tax=Oryzias latipes TaxID=8090 RepID=UPI000CE22000|nr:uncharacterized protein LOC105356638 [Oryzias latipes]